MTGNIPKISIIMNCYNGSSYLLQSITSVLNQSYNNWEIIFWDNQSTDTSAEIFSTINDNRLKYFLSQKKSNLGEARNKALQKCTGDYICFLDVDDYWEENKLQDQLEWFLTNSNYSFLYTNYNIVYHNRIKKNILSPKQPTGNVFEIFLEYYPVNLQTVMIKSDALKKIKYFFDSNLDLAEEYDFFLRILLDSKAGYINKAYVNYRVHNQMNSLKKIDKWPDEIEYIIKKFTKEITNFEIDYSNSIKKLKYKISYYKARNEMNKNNFKDARKHLFTYMFNDYKLFLLFFLTFFGNRIWNFIHRLNGKLATNK